ncbi:MULTISPECIES: hypothetical protein [unclassified Clostridium]|uniref:hypothetical protein n=1 Tax=unclassified Clostridium TaxID=2614128 RepID=UPI001D6C5944|nr:MULTISPECIES: hypothetical protein [unclassified Clostridium]MBN1044494.1 hypothetical protein [Clostridium botulinum]
MKVILYGIGSGRLRAEKYKKITTNIIGYSDSFFKEKYFNGKRFYTLNDLQNVRFDFIVICIGDLKIANNIVKQLIQSGIQPKKIVNFYEEYKVYEELYVPKRKVDRVMKYTTKPLDGIILGLSHAAYGINPNYLEKSFYNLAVDSYDLYYNLEQLEYIIYNYPDRIKNMKYLILNMHKYTYFNYDVSMSNFAVKFLKINGLEENSHNLINNTNYSQNEINTIIIKSKESKLMTKNSLGVFDSLFDTSRIDIVEDYKEIKVYENVFFDFPIRKNKLTDKDIQNYLSEPLKYSSIKKKKFYKTQKENKDIFRKILKTLNEINNDIKIYIVLIPMHKILEDIERIVETEWKKSFYDILYEFKEQYEFEILDFKNNHIISENNNYYCDLQHLNYEGSIAFTKLLNSYIE